MHRSLFLFLFLAISLKSLSQLNTVQDSIKHFSDSTFSLFEEHSLYSEKINWAERKIAFYEETSSISKFEGVFPLYQKIFDDLEDNHSFFWFNNQKFASNFGQLDESQIREPLIAALDNAEGKIVVEIIDNVGYIRIPQDNSSDDFTEMQKAAQKLQDYVCSIYRMDLKGWIIDLRLNTGGNMYPMIAGVLPFLPQATFASTIDRKGEKKNWRLEGKSIFEGDKKITELENICLPVLTSSKVAVLISEITGSSGEITTLAFLNRPKTIFIGEQSAGYMTSNELFRLPFETFFLLTNANETDSNGQIVKFIEPDMPMIDGDNFGDLANDLKVKEAISWINKPE